jgi:hypothetical protein
MAPDPKFAASKHLVIAGTGRAGTTVLVQLLAECGLDTRSKTLRYSDDARAGIETKLAGDDPPYVVKSPYLSEELRQLVAEGFDSNRIDAIVIPLRRLDDAVSSRLQNFRSHGIKAKGGLWRQERPSSQREQLAAAVHELLVTAALYRIPVVLLEYPSFVLDAGRAWSALRNLLPTDIDEQRFRDCHARVTRIDYVNDQRRYSKPQMALLDARWLVARMKRWLMRSMSARARRVMGSRSNAAGQGR